MEKTEQQSSKFMKFIRKWSRLLHRDIGFFFVGASIIYGLSGIALNHKDDWNPNYSVSVKYFTTQIKFDKQNTVDQINNLLEDLSVKEEYKTHYFTAENTLKAYLTSSSAVEINLNSGEGKIEILKRRPIFYQVNFLHFNPNNWWTWFSDIFAGSMILFAITSLFMIKGKKGAWGRGGLYILLGIIIPALILIFS